MTLSPHNLEKSNTSDVAFKPQGLVLQHRLRPVVEQNKQTTTEPKTYDRPLKEILRPLNQALMNFPHRAQEFTVHSSRCTRRSMQRTQRTQLNLFAFLKIMFKLMDDNGDSYLVVQSKILLTECITRNRMCDPHFMPLHQSIVLRLRLLAKVNAYWKLTRTYIKIRSIVGTCQVMRYWHWRQFLDS